jgi:hypothetical protein
VKFTSGPTLDQSLPIDMSKSPPIEVKRGNQTFNILSERGVITVVETTSGANKATPVVVGAGIALAATAGGRYVVALAPRAKPAANEMAIEPVVYTITW